MAILAGQISELIEIYARHGWSLRRILLTPETADAIGSLFVDLDVRESDIDAMWYSRAAVNGQETWELRVLGSTPFALNEFFDEDDDEDVRESAMAEIEDRIRARRPAEY
jgi:hypothetical protein